MKTKSRTGEADLWLNDICRWSGSRAKNYRNHFWQQQWRTRSEETLDPTFPHHKSEWFLCFGSKCCQELISDNEGVRTWCAQLFLLRFYISSSQQRHSYTKGGEMPDLVPVPCPRLEIDCLADMLVCLVTSKKFFMLKIFGSYHKKQKGGNNTLYLYQLFIFCRWFNT